jgi:NADPH:quinone reductase-like Zn-dependent oxidoreductase
LLIHFLAIGKVIGINVFGGYAEYVKVPATNLVRVPENLSYEQAAAMPITFSTAWHMLVTRARVSGDDTVLVLAAAGGIGIAATQISKIFGAIVLAAVGSDVKAERVRASGADEAINYSASDLYHEVMRLTAGRGVDIVVETIGSPTWDKSMRVIRPEGRLVCCGSTGGQRVDLNLRDLYRRNLTLFFTHGGTHSEMRSIFKLAGEGKLKPIVHSVYPLSEAANAHTILQSRIAIGKLLLNP